MERTEKGILLIDLGGHSRVAVMDLEGAMRSQWTETAQYFVDPMYPEGGKGFDAALLQQKMLDAAKKVIADSGVEIIACSSASQREGIVLMDKNGVAIAAYPNADMRGLEFMPKFDWELIARETFLPPLPLYGGQKIYGMKERHPEWCEKIETITSISEWAAYVFTGKAVFSRSQAVHFGAYNVVTGEWSEELCEMFGVRDGTLAPLADSGDLIGPVKEDIASYIGIAPDVPFFVGGADTQCAVSGAAAEIGDTVIVNGTTTPVMTPTDRCEGGPYWFSPAVSESKYVIEINTGNTGTNLEKIIAHFGASDKAKEGFAEIGKRFAAGELPPLIAAFSQNLFSKENYMKKGGFLMDNPMKADLDWIDYTYAMMMNNAMQVTEGALLAMKFADEKDGAKLIGVGGGFTGDVAAQVAADITGKEVLVYENFRESTIYGCFRIVLEKLGIEEPALKLRKAYAPTGGSAITDYHERWTAFKNAILPFSK